MSGSRMQWVSAEEKAHAADMWRNGHTLREIGEALAPRFGTPRTVAMLGVMFKDDRDAFPARKPGSCATVVAARIEARREEKSFHVPPERVDRAEAQAYDAASLHLPLADLEWKDCRWPVNDAARGETHLFCGHRAENPYGYCAHHALRAVGMGTRGENDAERALSRMGRAA